MQVALVLYPNFTLLDIVGPFQVFGDVPGDDVVFVASTPGPITEHTGRTALIASAALGEVPRPDVVVVPGGFGDTELDGAVVRWLRKVHATTTWTTSVCTGAIYLAAAGILDGVDATRTERRRRIDAAIALGNRSRSESPKVPTASVRASIASSSRTDLTNDHIAR